MELRPVEGFHRRAARAGGGVSKPTVAIVGRPNVGKSTLFNRILGGRPAIVSERPGTTRDRHFGDAEWQGRRFWVVDTGGLVPESDDSMDRAIRQQVEFALAEVGRGAVRGGRARGAATRWTGPSPSGSARRERPVVLAVNKLDDLERSTAQYDFYRLGFGDPIGRERRDREGKRRPARRGGGAAAAVRPGRRARSTDRRGGGGPPERGQVVARQSAPGRGAPRRGARGRHHAGCDRLPLAVPGQTASTS